MKRILKLLARLYPASWRRRYGAEYEALLEDATPRTRDAFDVFWSAVKMRMTSQSFVRIVVPCALAGALAAVGISFTQPELYRSQTLISVDTPDRISIDNELAEQVQDFLAQQFLISVIQKENLYPRERARMPMTDVVDLMKKNIWIRPLQAGNGKPAPAFVLQFVYPDPHVAQRVDAKLASQFIASFLRARINSPSAALLPRVTFRVMDVASLSQKPIFPKRGEFGVGGLLAGLVGGLILAAVAAWRRRLTVAAD